MDTEGNMLAFGDALSRDHGLILVIGREANNDLPIMPRIDEYTRGALDTGTFPNCDFWSKSYGLLSKFVGLEAHELKGKCIQERTSPIVFCDASPVAMNGDISPYQKRRNRKRIAAETLESHIAGVFSHSGVIERTGLVIVSGIIGCGLDHAVPSIETACQSNELPWCHIHSLSSTRHSHLQRIEQLHPHASLIRSILSESWGPRQVAA